MSDSNQNLGRLSEAVESLQKVVDARLGEDAIREKAFERLYAELKDYKEGFLREQERPLLLDLCLLYDSMSWFHQRLAEARTSPEALADAFQLLVDELLEVLYRRDVVPMERTEAFDPAIHKAVQLQSAPSAADDNHVAQVLKRGFLHHGKTLRPEDVVVWRWKGGTP